MPLSDLIERLGRTIFEAPFAGSPLSRDQPELAEIRLALIDEVKSRSHQAGGRRVFPHNFLRVHLLGVPESESAPFTGDFFRKYFEDELRAGLKKSSYRFPEDLQLEFRTSSRLPAPKEAWIQIEAESRVQAAAELPVPARRTAKLIVVRGTANQPELALKKARTNIGRTKEVSRVDGPSRRNDLAFTEDTEINRTVSREHAHVLYRKADGEYRLYNDRWYKNQNSKGNCGLWIIRDGLSQEVHRNPRGFKLLSGDDIQLGQAIVRFQLK